MDIKYDGEVRLFESNKKEQKENLFGEKRKKRKIENSFIIVLKEKSSGLERISGKRQDHTYVFAFSIIVIDL